MPPQPPKPDNANFRQKIEIVQALALFPAITVLVFLRTRIGFRLLKPAWLIIMTVIMISVALVFGSLAEPFRSVMILFALAMLTLGLIQRYKRWAGLCNGERWHTYCPGISYLEMLPLPGFFRSHRRTNRFLDPAACILAGLIVGLLLSQLLGLWILIAGLALYIFEQNLYDKALERDLDTLDGLVSAEVQGETVKHFEQPQAEQKQRTLEETAGIPTGLAPDIHKQVELRRARRAQAPDNLATENLAV